MKSRALVVVLFVLTLAALPWSAAAADGFINPDDYPLNAPFITVADGQFLLIKRGERLGLTDEFYETFRKVDGAVSPKKGDLLTAFAFYAYDRYRPMPLKVRSRDEAVAVRNIILQSLETSGLRKILEYARAAFRRTTANPRVIKEELRGMMREVPIGMWLGSATGSTKFVSIQCVSCADERVSPTSGVCGYKQCVVGAGSGKGSTLSTNKDALRLFFAEIEPGRK